MKGNPDCTLCPLHQDAREVCVITGGPRRARVMVVTDSARAGWEELGELLEEYGIEDVYFASAVSCELERDARKVTKSHVAKCSKWLEYQIQMVKPEFVLVAGNNALLSIKGKQGITKERGRPFELEGITYLPTFSVAYAYYDESAKTLLENDLQLFRDIIKFGGVPEEEELDIRLVTSWDDVDEMLEDLTGAVSFDIETNSLYPWQVNNSKGEKDPARIVSIGFGTRNTQWIVPVKHPDSPWDDDELGDIVEEITERLDDCLLIAHNGKFDLLWMRVHFGVEWKLDFDTMLAHYLLDENMRHGLKFLARIYLNAPDWEVDLDTKQGHGPLNKVAKYHAHDLFYTRKLRYVFGKQLSKDRALLQVFQEILMPCANLFVNVEFDGVYIDVNQFDEAERVIRQNYEDALAELQQWEPKDLTDKRGRPQQFNWGSTQQLADLLFRRLKLPVIEKTAAGNPSCSESVIKRLDHPCTEALLKFRAAKQQLSFFIEGWKPFLHERPDGFYLHPSFKLHGTVTGRLSCEHPNLQQVPRDKRIRTLITAPPGWTLIECDLSQVELRIAAELAGERAMIYAFQNGIDVHWLTAMREISRGEGLRELVMATAFKITGAKKLTYSQAVEALIEAGHEACIEVEEEWKEFRKKAKAINFGYLYGMWWKKFKQYARDNYGIIIEDHEAEASRVAFFDLYSDLEAWHRQQRRYAARHGYVRSLSGRKRRLPAAMSSEDTPEKREAQRQAINSPVQSFANEINLMAAIQLSQEYSRDVVRICGTVHDAILVRVRDEYVEEVYHRLLKIMQRPALMDDFGIKLAVPVEADGSIGPWGAGVSVDKWKGKRT